MLDRALGILLLKFFQIGDKRMFDKIVELYEDVMNYLFMTFILALCLMLLALTAATVWGMVHPKEWSEIMMAKDSQTIQRVLDKMNK